MATILAIDDRQDNLSVLSRVLEKLIHGSTVVTAQSGAEGIEKAIAELPDAILLDIIMPEMDGYEVCKRLKSDEKTKHIPVIMLTGIQTDCESRVKGLEIGADAFLTKPIDGVELVAQVNAMLRIKRAEDLLRKEKDLLEDTVRETTNELRKSEELYRLLVEAIDDGIGMIDTNGLITYANRKLCEMYGYLQDEIIGHPVTEFLDEANMEIFTEQMTGIREGKYFASEFTYTRKDGQKISTFVSPKPILDADGRFKGAFAAVTDICALKKAQEEIRALAKFPTEDPNPVLRIARDGTILYANDASQPLLSSWTCQPGQRLPDTWCRIALDVFNFGSSANAEVELVDRVLSLTFASVAGSDYVNVYGFDVTERRRIEGLLKEREKQLFQSQKMEALGTLVAGVAHEINNPVSLMMFNVPLLQEIWHDLQPIVAEYASHEPDRKYGGLKYKYLRKRLDQLLGDMDLASNRIANTVSGLKNFARQSDIADKKPMLINEAVRNAVQLSQTSARKAGIDMVADLPDDLAPVSGNPQAMEQIVLNLIVNAIEAIDHEHGRIEITSGFEEKRERISVSVSDNGAGVDPDIAHRVFDPFVTSKMAEGGTGLGLSITHNLVRAHGGAITFQSERGKGTTFTLSFPSALEEKRAKILVVDDDQEFRETLIDALTTVGPYLVDEAPNGAEACIKLGTYRPDLIVLNLLMPEMDGLEVCRNLRREPELSDIKVLITTAFPDHPKAKEIVELGFRNMCSKSFTTKDLVDKVDECLRDSD